jgi:hypothetical protein
MAAVLPPSPDSRVALRVHRMRIARGACWVISAALFGLALLTMLDAAARPAGWARSLGLAVWLTGSGVLAWRMVLRHVRPTRMRQPAREARKQLGGNVNAAAAAAGTLAVCLVCTICIPGIVEHIRRVVLPWYRPAGSLYRVIVTSSEPVVRSGEEAITLSAYAEKVDHPAEVPDLAMAFVRDSAGTEASHVMNPDGTGAFHLTLPPATADMQYRIEIAGATSEWFKITPIKPATPTSQTIIEIQPPEYAAKVVAKQSIEGFRSIEGLQYGRASFRIVFSQPVATALLEWKPDGSTQGELLPLGLSGDKLSAVANLTLSRDGMLRLVAVTERDGKTLSTPSEASVRARPDQPPSFQSIHGVSAQPRLIRPGQEVPIEFRAKDDIGVASAALEYVVGTGNPATVPLALTTDEQGRIHGRLAFLPPGEVREGNSVRYRLRLTDTRRIDSLGVKPQETVFPRQGWAISTVAAAAPSLQEQEIAAEGETVQAALEEAVSELEAAHEAIQRCAKPGDGFATHHSVLLGNARDSVRKASAGLAGLAAEPTLTAAVEPLVTSIQRSTGAQLRNVDEALREVLSEHSASREAALAMANQNCVQAISAIKAAMARNRRLARLRLDGNAIREVLAEQERLFTQTRGVAEVSEELIAAQYRLEERLARLVAASELLRAAVQEARDREIESLAAAAAGLRLNAKQLDEAITRLETRVRSKLLDTIADQAEPLGKQASHALERTDTAARLANVIRPNQDEFPRIGPLIRDGKTVEALTELERLAKALETVAVPFEQWESERTSAKIAARHLTLWLEDILVRLRKGTTGKPEEFLQLPLDQRNAFRRETEAVRGAIARLDLPGQKNLEQIREEAVRQLDEALAAMEKPDADWMKPLVAATSSVQRLAERTPGTVERLAKTRTELEKIRQHQEAILNAAMQGCQGVDAAAPGAYVSLARKLAPTLAHQAKQLADFQELDLPGFEPRRSRTIAALKASIADLEGGLPQNIPASQMWVKRELERLKMAVDGFSPPDEKMHDLAVRLETLAPPSVEAVQDISRQLLQVTQPASPEATVLRNDAIEAIRALEAAFRGGTRADELKFRLRIAADALEKFSDKLCCAESNLEQVERLAWNRRLALFAARELQGKGVNRGASDEARRQLAREQEELRLTRVGAAGQVLKQRLIELYSQARDASEPDRQANLQKSLALLLDELAGAMAESPESTVHHARVAPPPPAAASDDYLPSRALARTLRQAAERQRRVRDQLNRVGDEVIRLTRPGRSESYAAIESRHQTFMNKLTKLIDQVDPARESATTVAAAGNILASARAISPPLETGSADLAHDAARSCVQALRDFADFGSTTSWSKGARELASELENIETGIAQVMEEPGEAAAQQMSRALELSRRAEELAATLAAASNSRAITDPAKDTLGEAAAIAQRLPDLLRDLVQTMEQRRNADAHTARESIARGEKLRKDAGKVLDSVEQKMKPLVPAGSPRPSSFDYTLGTSVRNAQAAMRQVKSAMADKSIRNSTEAMQRTCRALKSMAQQLEAAQ